MAAPRTNHVLRRTAGVVENATVELPPLKPNEVLIKITHSGLCHTDAVYHGFGKEMAFGHEGVGVVEEIGSAVTTLKVGQRVGGGYFREVSVICGFFPCERR
jgi:D-arabinose 1-dehydrogenase-like Zn-dependent alcohol dehydrogenase